MDDLGPNDPTADAAITCWLDGELESPIARDEDEHGDNFICIGCGELYNYCECQIPRLNEDGFDES